MAERLPPWFKKRMPKPGMMAEMNALLGGLHLNTICQSALCPNIGDCFSRHTATFLVLGDTCTRNCTFCAVSKGKPEPVDPDEPAHVAEAVARLKLRHVVITSVTRDDLPDGGAAHFAAIIRLLKQQDSRLTVEVLVPDFRGSAEALRTVMVARPDVLNHNVETVPRLYPEVRPMADFSRSIGLLKTAKAMDPTVTTKSGLMVGLGETPEEVAGAMESLRAADCDLLTIGQYLAPSPKHHPVVNFVTPEQFDEFARLGKRMGFREVASAPLVRSSFEAAALYGKMNANA